MTTRIIDFRAFTNSAILCHFEDILIPQLLELFGTITGWYWTPEELMQAGERIYTLKRVLNHRFGLTRAGDTLPKPVLQTLEDGPTAGYAPDIETLLGFYYQVRNWDPVSGRPCPEKLSQLGLAEFSPELWQTTLRQPPAQDS